MNLIRTLTAAAALIATILVTAEAPASATPVPTRHQPVVTLEPADHTVKVLHTTYVDEINSRFSVVEYNTGAMQAILNCGVAPKHLATVCVHPHSGNVQYTLTRGRTMLVTFTGKQVNL